MLTSLHPQEARLRNLTYSSPLYVDISSRVLQAEGVEDPVETDWQPVLDIDGRPAEESEKVFIGKVRSDDGDAR